MRGATRQLVDGVSRYDLISIHAPHARSDGVISLKTADRIFQSTLLMRGATSSRHNTLMADKFQSTLLMRGATIAQIARIQTPLYFNPRSSCEERRCGLVKISTCTHFNPRSSCEERPASIRHSCASPSYFNPRSSCEERLPSPRTSTPNASFQSTLLMRGATRGSRDGRQAPRISIHAPHARSDAKLRLKPQTYYTFQSTLLMRGATWLH